MNTARGFKPTESEILREREVGSDKDKEGDRVR